MRPALPAWAAVFAAVLGIGCAHGSAPVPHATVPKAVPKAPAWLADRDDPLGARVGELAEGLGREGWRPTPQGRSGFLAEHADRTVAVSVPAGRCLTIVALASPGMGDLDATLYAPDGTVLARDREPDAHPTIQVCGGATPRRAYYHLQSYEGAGRFVFGAFEGERARLGAAARVVGGRPGVAAVPAGMGDRARLLRAWVEGIESRGFEVSLPPRAIPMDEGQRIRLPLPVEAGHCYTVAAIAPSGVTSLGLRLLDPGDHALRVDTSDTARAAAQICPEADAELSVELFAARGSGEVRIAILSASAEAAGGPRAMWLGRDPSDRAVERSVDQAQAKVRAEAKARGARSSPRPVARGTLRFGEAVSHEVQLPARRCTRLTVAVGRGGRRLWMRIEDARGRVMFEGERDAADVHAEVCTERTQTARVILVARAGSARYVLLTEPTDRPEGTADSK